ncbi:hypothetical protein GY15_05050 [Delftia sp. 670]|nr:hypothetical protein GY15_05050 [Delftia sp. 670]
MQRRAIDDGPAVRRARDLLQLVCGDGNQGAARLVGQLGADSGKQIVPAVVRQLRGAQHIAHQVVHAPFLLACIALRIGQRGLQLRGREFAISQCRQLFALRQIVIHDQSPACLL